MFPKRKNLFLVGFFFFLVLFSSVYFFREARGWIGKPFDGFLIFINGMVGSYNQFDWTGTKAGLRYHDLTISVDENEYLILSRGRGLGESEVYIPPMVFSLRDFWQVFMIPFVTGLLFLILGGIIFWVMKGTPGSFPLLFFNLGLAYYLLGSFDFHTDYTLTSLYTLILALMPAFMNHFSWAYPSRAAWRGKVLFIPYIISVAVWIPYYLSLVGGKEWDRTGMLWILSEYALIGYMVLSYLFWLYRLSRQTSYPTHPFNQVVAKSLLIGQLLAFIVPLVAIIAIFLFQSQVPLNLIAPITLLFPIATLFGVVLGNLRRTQLQLVQTEKMAGLGNMLAGIAHEINNPTTYIYSNLKPLKGYLNYIKDVVKNDAPPYKGEMPVGEVVKDLDLLTSNIEEGAQRTKDIIESLRGFARGQADAKEEVDINQSIDICLRLLSHQIKERIEVDKQYGVLPKLQSNSGELKQVWMNLLSNAAQAVSGRGKIYIQTTADKKEIRVVIQDTGAGIPKDRLERIFDPFYTTKDQGEGTGLGLAISRELVERHKGAIDVSSEIGKGATFTVRLPMG